MKGEGNQQDYGMRIYDPRLGKFLSVDPLTEEYPWYTPYQFAGNTPIQAIDLDGLEEWKVNGSDGSKGAVNGPFKDQKSAQEYSNNDPSQFGGVTLSNVTVVGHKKFSIANNSAPKASFEAANKITSHFEGGWSFKKQDPGGATMRGIIFSNFKMWSEPDLGLAPTLYNLKALTPDQASILYKKHFWSKISGDEFNDGNVANAIYDFSVQSGRGISQVEKAFNAVFGGITVDGKLNKDEVTLLNKINGRQLFDLIQDTRVKYLNNVVIPGNVRSYMKKHSGATQAEVRENTLLKWSKSLNNRITNVKYR